MRAPASMSKVKRGPQMAWMQTGHQYQQFTLYRNINIRQRKGSSYSLNPFQTMIISAINWIPYKQQNFT